MNHDESRRPEHRPRSVNSARLLGLGFLLVLSPAVTTACAERTDQMEPQSDSVSAGMPDTHRTSREIYDEFLASSDAAILATGAEGWKLGDGTPWSLEDDQVLYPGPCEGADRSTGPWHMEQHVFGPPSQDPEGAREQMRAYFESRDMTITAEFQPEPGDPPQATWTVTAETDDGGRTKYWSNPLQQSLLFTSECSSDPSMYNEVSQTAP